jgi:hypothetical protein
MKNTNNVTIALLLVTSAYAAYRYIHRPAPAQSPRLASSTNSQEPAGSSLDEKVKPSPALQAVSPSGSNKESPARQPAMKEDPLAEFQAHSSRPWTVAKDPFTGRIRTLNGGGFHLEGESEIQKAEAFKESYASSLFSVPSSDLQTMTLIKTDRTKIMYQQAYGGYPVYGATLGLIFENQELARVQSDLVQISKPNMQVPAFSSDDAFALYKSNLSGDTKSSVVSDAANQPQLLLFPSSNGSAVFVYHFYVDSPSVGGSIERFEVIVDAENQRVIRKHSTHIN